MAKYRPERVVDLPGCNHIDLETMGLWMKNQTGQEIEFSPPGFLIKNVDINQVQEWVEVSFDPNGPSAGHDTRLPGVRSVNLAMTWGVPYTTLVASPQNFYAFETGPVEFLLWASPDNQPLKRWELTVEDSYLVNAEVAPSYSTDYVNIGLSIVGGECTSVLVDQLSRVTGFMSRAFDRSPLFNPGDKPPSKPSGPRRVVRRKST